MRDHSVLNIREDREKNFNEVQFFKGCKDRTIGFENLGRQNILRDHSVLNIREDREKNFNEVQFFKGCGYKTILIRCDFNVPISEDGKLLDDSRIVYIKKLLDSLANHTIILLTHFMRPKNKEPIYSTKNLIPFLEKILKKEIVFLDNFIEKPCDQKIYLFENLRFWEGETKNDLSFAKKLSNMGDIYINEAFSVSHRKHASIVSIQKLLPSYYGPHFRSEIKALDKIKKIDLLILGGAKSETKIKYIKKINAKNTFIGGAIANTFLKAKGYPIGKSIYDEKLLEIAKSLDVILPIDVITNKRTCDISEVANNEIIYDIGIKTQKKLSDLIEKSKTIVLNGVIGFVEKGFIKGTESIINSMNKNKKLNVILGGGDTIGFIPKNMSQIKHISIGGGAFLHYLANKSFPK